MRAKTVNENVNFERGQDPRSVMDIGAPELAKIVFDAWEGNSLDGGFVKRRYVPEKVHEYLQNLQDGKFEETGSNVYRHPTRVWYYFKGEDSSKDWRQIAGTPIRYEGKLYSIPKELGDLEWKKRNI